MKIDIVPRQGLFVLDMLKSPHVHTHVFGLSEHDLNDLEFALAQRKAMSSRCGEEHGEHTCGIMPDHTHFIAHICRACTVEWK